MESQVLLLVKTVPGAGWGVAGTGGDLGKIKDPKYKIQFSTRMIDG